MKLHLQARTLDWVTVTTGVIPIADEQERVIGYACKANMRDAEEVVARFNRNAEAEELLDSCVRTLAGLPAHNMAAHTMRLLIEEFLGQHPPEPDQPSPLVLKAQERIRVIEGLIAQLGKDWETADQTGQDFKVREITERLKELRAELKLLQGRVE